MQSILRLLVINVFRQNCFADLCRFAIVYGEAVALSHPAEE